MRLALDWFQKAAEQGHAPSQSELGTLLHLESLDDQPVAPGSKNEGLLWLNKATEQGDARATSLLALLTPEPPSTARSPIESRQPVSAMHEQHSHSSCAAHPIYDIPGWLIAITLFAYLAFDVGPATRQCRELLPSLLRKRSILLLLALLTAILVTIKAAPRS